MVNQDQFEDWCRDQGGEVSYNRRGAVLCGVGNGSFKKSGGGVVFGGDQDAEYQLYDDTLNIKCVYSAGSRHEQITEPEEVEIQNGELMINGENLTCPI